MKDKLKKAMKYLFETTLVCLAFVSVISLTSANANTSILNTTSNKNLTMVRTAEDEKIKLQKQEAIQVKLEESKIVYDGLTMDELINKLNRNLGSSLAGKGKVFAEYSLQRGIDPYLVVAIVLHETGCKYGCSGLTKQCNNVGGQKGSPSCGGSSYKAFSTLDDGIRGMIDNLYYNYYSRGLRTPEAINKKYAESMTWSAKINNYMRTIKAN